MFRVEEGLMEIAQLKERELRGHMEIHSLKVPTPSVWRSPVRVDIE